MKKLKAFISCSLRPEDKKYVDFVSELLSKFNIEPFGTVGYLDASPIEITKLMRKNIHKSDMLVIVATERYLSKDIKTKKKFKSISEMLQVEAGIAYSKDIPILVFSFNNVEVGNFISKVTQYINVDVNQEVEKNQLVKKYIENAINMSKNNRIKRTLKITGYVTSGVLIGMLGVLIANFALHADSIEES